MTYTWIMKSGKTAKLEATYTEHVADGIADLDGDKFHTGKKIVKEAYLAAYVDGKKIDCSQDENFWKIIDVPGMPGIKRIWGIQNIGFDAQTAAEIEAFLREVIEAGKTEEAEQVRKEEEEKALQEEIADAREIIRKAEAQKDIPSSEEAERRMKRYNDVNNDGGYGFVPHIVSREEYEAAMALVARAGRNEQ